MTLSFKLPLGIILLSIVCSTMLACARPNIPKLDSTIETATAIGKYGSISYSYSSASTPSSDSQGVLFLHGTPGDRSAFQDYLNKPLLTKDLTLVSIDRYGWGSSAMPDDQNDYSFAQQADAATKVMKSFAVDKWIIVGHSYGSSLASKVALEQNQSKPNSVKAMILIAGSLDPKLGKPRWYNHIANLKLLAWALPNKLRKANREIMNLKAELSKLNVELEQSELPQSVIIIQGDKDKLVSPRNIDFAKQAWSERTQLRVMQLDGVGHFIPWENSDVVVDAILSVVTPN